MLDEDIDERLYREFESFAIKQIKAGQDPIICAMIMVSLALGTFKTLLERKEQEDMLRLINEYLKSEEYKLEVPDNITYH